MIAMTLTEMALAMGGRLDISRPSVMGRRVVTDSREVRCGDVFFALRGEHHDGHRFVRQALDAGAACCVCEAPRRGEVRGMDPMLCLWVENVTVALGRLAAYYRRRIMPATTKVIAVTGSNGKTTTKRMIDHVLAGSRKGHCSPKSFNNDIGVPVTLLSAEADDEYLVVEIGTNAPGEVAALARMTAPDIGVITSIGEAHLEGLGGVEGVAAEKASLLRFLRPDGFAVLNVDNAIVERHLETAAGAALCRIGRSGAADLRVTDVSGTIRGTKLTLDGRHDIELPMPGVHHATNAAAAFAVGRWFGLTADQIAERLRTFVPPEGRTNVSHCAGVTIVDDAYNANPSSMAAAVALLASQVGGRRVLVMGDMLELGGQALALHRRVIEQARTAGVEVVLGVGPLTREAARSLGSEPLGQVQVLADSPEAACTGLEAMVREGDTVLVKGSRGMRMEKVVEWLQTRVARTAAVA